MGGRGGVVSCFHAEDSLSFVEVRGGLHVSSQEIGQSLSLGIVGCAIISSFYNLDLFLFLF